jgi:hypothetical protein
MAERNDRETWLLSSNRDQTPRNAGRQDDPDLPDRLRDLQARGIIARQPDGSYTAVDVLAGESRKGFFRKLH